MQLLHYRDIEFSILHSLVNLTVSKVYLNFSVSASLPLENLKLKKKLIRGCLTPIILFFVQKGLPFPFLRSVFEQSKIDGADEACTQLYLRIQSQLGSNLGMVFQKILQ